jgi:hypothetical protein
MLRKAGGGSCLGGNKIIAIMDTKETERESKNRGAQIDENFKNASFCITVGKTQQKTKKIAFFMISCGVRP